MSAVTFIIPHKGRENFLCETLRSINALDRDSTINIVVVTQNDSLSSETKAAGSDLLRIVHADPKLSISALRNIGVRESDSDYLAFLDADVALSKNWLDALLALFQSDEAIVLVSAMQVSGEDPPPLECIRTALSNAVVDGPVSFLPGRNLLLRRDTHEQVGGFPEHLITCEDYYYTDQVSKLGKLWYSSRANYVHLGEDKRLSEMFGKEVWRGQSNLQSLRGRKIGLSEWPSFIVPPWICVFMLAAAILSLLDGSTSGLLAGLALGAAVLPFSAYVARLYILAKRRIPLGHIVAFYAVYFPARAWGTLLGSTRSLGRDLHDH